MLPPLKPIPIKERISLVFMECGPIDALDGDFSGVDTARARTHVVREHDLFRRTIDLASGEAQ